MSKLTLSFNFYRNLPRIVFPFCVFYSSLVPQVAYATCGSEYSNYPTRTCQIDAAIGYATFSLRGKLYF